MKLTSFEADIRPLFTDRDIQGMSEGFNLASYDDVKKHAVAIYDRIRGVGGAVMPPPPYEEKAHGLNRALNYLLSGCRKGFNPRTAVQDVPTSEHGTEVRCDEYSNGAGKPK